jgi:hypothetical protein
MATETVDFSGLAGNPQVVANAYAQIQSPVEATQTGTLQPNEPGLKKLRSYTPPVVKWPKQ